MANDRVNDWWHQHFSESANGERWTVTFESPRAERCLPPWYSDREWPNGNNPFKEKLMSGDDKQAESIFDVQRVDRTNGLHTHHCWHKREVVSSWHAHDAQSLDPESVVQSCCECPAERIVRRGETGTWTPAQEQKQEPVR